MSDEIDATPEHRQILDSASLESLDDLTGNHESSVDHPLPSDLSHDTPHLVISSDTTASSSPTEKVTVADLLTRAGISFPPSRSGRHYASRTNNHDTSQNLELSQSLPPRPPTPLTLTSTHPHSSSNPDTHDSDSASQTETDSSTHICDESTSLTSSLEPTRNQPATTDTADEFFLYSDHNHDTSSPRSETLSKELVYINHDLTPQLQSAQPGKELIPYILDDSHSPQKSSHSWLLVIGRTFTALAAVTALILTGLAWQWSSSKNHNLNHVSALDPYSHDIVDPGGQTGDENFLIVGTDTRAGENSQVGAGDTSDAEGSRSDTIMLVNIPASRKRVVVVSFPRDLAITPIACTSWDPTTGTYGSTYNHASGTYTNQTVYTTTKLNSTYAFGGPLCLVKEIQKLSGLAINRFMALDFVGFDRIVDALGGVEVCTTAPLYDGELGTVLDQPGRQVIDGATALNYVRARNVAAEGNGDYGRIKRQQKFLSSLLRSLISAHTFFSPSKLNHVVDLFIADATVDGISTKDLVELGQSLQNISAGHVTFVTVPTGATDENGDEPPRMKDMRALFNAIINDDPLPGENDHNVITASSNQDISNDTTTESTRKFTALPAEEITIQVSNNTDRAGLARSVSAELEQFGFNTATPNNYSGSLKKTTVLFSSGNEQAAATVAKTLGNVSLEQTTGLGKTIHVVLGPDFHSLQPPPSSGEQIDFPLQSLSHLSPPTDLPKDLTITNAADTTC